MNTTFLENNPVESQTQAGVLTSEAQAFLSKLAAAFSIPPKKVRRILARVGRRKPRQR
jgi:hypothetical protein